MGITGGYGRSKVGKAPIIAIFPTPLNQVIVFRTGKYGIKCPVFVPTKRGVALDCNTRKGCQILC